MKLLLHCCCAPCSVSCAESLRSEGIEPHLFWYNPNIHPFTEYEARRDCLCLYAANEKLKLTLIDEYDLNLFLDTVHPDTGSRCQKCYRLRFEKTASFAAENGFTAFTTTLLISPYQDHEAIKRAGTEAAEKYGIQFFYKDFRPNFREGQTKARNQNLYMQKYCGCIFSEEERYKEKNEEKSQQITRINANKNKNLNINSCQFVSFVDQIFQRLQLITGNEGLEKLQNTSVIIFGVGGVGSWCAQALVRSGIGKITLVDFDNVCPSNINRQLQATSKTIGRAKVEVLKDMLAEINPDCEIIARNEMFCLENADTFGIEQTDYVIDAIDIMTHKLDLIEKTCLCGVKLFSCMGMALRIDPCMIKTSTIWKTKECPLARDVRQGLRKRGVTADFTVVYSSEQPVQSASVRTEWQKPENGSVVTVTASAGLLLANLVLRDVTGM